MTIQRVSPIPVYDPLVRARNSLRYQPGERDPLEGTVTDAWTEYFSKRDLVINDSSIRINKVTLTGQNASIAATDFSGMALSAGHYRVSYYMRVTTAAGVSSSATFVLSFTESSVALSISGAAMTGNTTATLQEGTHVIRVDNATPIKYAITYASNPASAMIYRLDVLLEQVNV